MEILNRVRERKRASNLFRERNREMEMPETDHAVRERNREMRNPNDPARERKKEMEDSDSLATERNGGIERPGNVVGEIQRDTENPNALVGEREEGMGSPSSLLTERNEDLENSDPLGGERNGGVESPNDLAREGEVETPTSLVVRERRREVDTPPVDDCCPICFGSFTMACKTNCGHWFCGGCILQYWNYTAVVQRCKCPICTCLISKLTPEASLTLRKEGEVLEVLKNVQRYNRLFVGGAHGLILKILEFPRVIRRMFQGLMDPDRFRFNYYLMRYLALLLSILYEISNFDFIPMGRVGTRRLFDFCAVALVVSLCLVGICRRRLLRRRVRLFAAPQP